MAENTEFQDIFSTVTLQRALEIKFDTQEYVRRTYFGETNKSNTVFIQVDKFKHSRKVATFVNANLQSRHVERRGFDSDVFFPPYIKENKTSEAYNILKRPFGGSPYGAAKSPRAMALEELGKDTAELKDRVLRRIELMCATVLLTGGLTVQGDGIDITYDYNWPDANYWSVGNSKIPVIWSTTTSDILSDIERALQLVADNTGRIGNKVLLGRTIAKYLRKNEEILALLDNRRVDSGQLKLDTLPKGVRFEGSIGEVDYFSYVEKYEDDSDALQDVFDPEKVVVTSTDLRASMEFGAIRDLEFVSPIPAEWFLKSWMEKDPSVQVVLIQSSPLPVHHQMEGVVVLDPLQT